MKVRRELVRVVIFISALVLFMLVTKPSSMPVYLLFIPFALLGFGLYQFWRLLVAIYSGRAKETAQLSRKQRAAGITMSVLAIITIGLESLGEMTIRDAITVTLFAVGAYFYFVRNLTKE